MRSFLIFLGIVAIVGLIWAVTPFLDQRARDHEERLVAALNLVESAIVGSSADILRVDLFAPEIEPLSGDGRWRLTGIVETQDHAAKAVHVRFAGDVAFACLPYDEARCGKIEMLTIEGQPLVVEGATVAELQSVLDAISAASGTTAPAATGAGTAAPAAALSAPTLPAPQMSAPPTEAAPAGDAPAAAGAPTEPPAPMAAIAAPSAESVPIQGDRLIFLIQKGLRERGHDPGPVDGQVGPRTTLAIQTYQELAGMPVDGQPSAALLEHMNRTAPAVTQ